MPTRGAFRLIFLMGAVVSRAGVIATAFIPKREQRYDDTATIPTQQGPSKTTG